MVVAECDTMEGTWFQIQINLPYLCCYFNLESALFSVLLHFLAFVVLRSTTVTVPG